RSEVPENLSIPLSEHQVRTIEEGIGVILAIPYNHRWNRNPVRNQAVRKGRLDVLGHHLTLTELRCGPPPRDPPALRRVIHLYARDLGTCTFHPHHAHARIHHQLMAPRTELGTRTRDRLNH